MGKVLYWLLLAGICCSLAEVVEELPATESGTTPVSTTPLTTVTHSNIKDSTSDTWLDLHPGAKTEFTTTVSTTTAQNTETIDNAETDLSLTPQNEDSSEDDKDDKISSSENMCDGEMSQAELRKFSDAMMAFSKDLLKQVNQGSKSTNVVVSPLSVALGLLQLTLGAQEETEKKLLETLHVESLPCIHEKLQKVTRRLMQNVLSIAARMYVDKDLKIKESFLEKSEKLYGSKPKNLGPNKKDNLDSINKWVSDATNGKIKNFLSDLPEKVALILLNAIHFKGFWKNKFDPSKTSEDMFYLNDEETTLVDMMHANRYPLSYYTFDKLDSQVARLPFKGNMSFVIVMPHQMTWNVSNILDKLNRSELYSRFHRERPTSLKVPKLNLDFKLDLRQALINLGLGQLFKEPDLGGISDDKLIVSSVEHQSMLDLNEEGVEATGVTAVVTSRSLSTFSVNRPFLFLVMDDHTGLVLFCGYVRSPKPGSPKRKKDHGYSPEILRLPKGVIPK